MTCHVHSHGVHRGAAASRLQQYSAFFRELYTMGSLDRDLSLAALSLDDEDVRYTTDAEPGFHDKLAALRCLREFCGAELDRPVSFWDLYAAPGMDVVYCMLLACCGFGVRVTGASIVRDERDEARFRRMEGNVASAAAHVPRERCEVTLARSSALDFCRGYAGARPDVLVLSMPWMTTMGELERGAEGRLRDSADMMREARELLRALRPECRPRVVLLMVPFGPECVALPEYALWETLFNHKCHARGGGEISCYCTHVLARTSAPPPARARSVVFRYFVGPAT